MKKLFSIYVLLLFLSLNGYSQGINMLDSLKHELSLADQDTTKALILTELSANFRFSNLDSALHYGKEAYELSEKINYPKGKIIGLGLQGLALVWLGDLPEALRIGFESLNIANESNEVNSQIPLSVIGMVYFELKNYPKALFYMKKQLEAAKLNGDRYGGPYALTDIGEVLGEMNLLDSAELYHKQAIRVFDKMGRVDPLVYNRLGKIEMKRGNRTQAKNYFNQSLEIAMAFDEKRSISESYLHLSNFFDHAGDIDSAILYAKKSLSVSASIAQKKFMLGAANALAAYYENIDARESLAYYKMSSNIKESMFGSGNLQVIQGLIASEEQRQKELEEAEASFQNRLRMNALMGSTFTLVVVAFFLYRNNRQKQKAKRKAR